MALTNLQKRVDDLFDLNFGQLKENKKYIKKIVNRIKSKTNKFELFYFYKDYNLKDQYLMLILLFHIHQQLWLRLT